MMFKSILVVIKAKAKISKSWIALTNPVPESLSEDEDSLPPVSELLSSLCFLLRDFFDCLFFEVLWIY